MRRDVIDPRMALSATNVKPCMNVTEDEDGIVSVAIWEELDRVELEKTQQSQLSATAFKLFLYWAVGTAAAVAGWQVGQWLGW